MALWSPDAWLAAWSFAAKAHAGQTVPGTDLPYLVHIGAVAMEVTSAISQRALGPSPVQDPTLAVQCALLHDVVEDTETTVAAIQNTFGSEVAAGVSALSKDPAAGDKSGQMQDSLRRILLQPQEVWMVKLADRVTNLQPPPAHWSVEKVIRYGTEAELIRSTLGDACPVLEPRLCTKIAGYGSHAH